MEKSFGLHFHLKKCKDHKNGELPVYVRITVNGAYCEISSKRKCDSYRWNVAAGRAAFQTDKRFIGESFIEN
jgi:hypothetical protein